MGLCGEKRARAKTRGRRGRSSLSEREQNLGHGGKTLIPTHGYRAGKFIAIAPSNANPPRWLHTMTIGLRVALQGAMAECNTKTACG